VHAELKRCCQLFPVLRDVKVTHTWAGAGVPRDWFASVGVNRAANCLGRGLRGDGSARRTWPGAPSRTCCAQVRRATELTALPWVATVAALGAGAARCSRQPRPAGDGQRHAEEARTGKPSRRAAVFAVHRSLTLFNRH